MDLSIFGEQYRKSIADAMKIGAVDSKTDSVMQDVIKTMGAEIKRKEDLIQRTAGEIGQLKNMHGLLLAVIKNHTRSEQANVDAEADRKRLLEETVEEKEAKLAPKKTKKKVVKKPTTRKKTTNKFVGDAS